MDGYGWVLASDVSFGGLIVFLFLIGYTTDVVGQTLMVLCVDLNPKRPANVSAANIVVKCLVGAAVFDWQPGPDCEYALWNFMAASEEGESRDQRETSRPVGSST